MISGEVCLGINDYLDLYLIAGKLGEKLWQQEIIQKLQKFEYMETYTLELMNIRKE